MKETIIELLGQIEGQELSPRKKLEILAASLSEIDGRENPWTWRYLESIIKGHKGIYISKDLARAIDIQARLMDGQSPIQARAREVVMLCVNGAEEGSVVLGHTRRCRTCNVKFIPISANGKYCCKEHREAYYKQKRMEKPEQL